MSWSKRALCYIKRKRAKAFLLFMVFYVASFTVMGAKSVLNATGQISRKMKEESGAKITLDNKDEKNAINGEDVMAVSRLQNISRLNRITETAAYPDGFMPIEGAGDGVMGAVMIHGYDDMEKDSPFEEKIGKIVEGRFAKDENEIVVSRILAEQNKIKIGDEISFLGKDDRRSSANVAGFYQTGSENSQTEKVLTENRMENQIYASNQLIQKLCGKEEYKKIAVYVSDPDHLEQTKQEISALCEKKADVGTLNTAYQKIRYAIQQAERITKLIFVLMMATSVFITGMLLCMWMRNRKAEMAVFISMGIAKAEVYFQMVFETVLVYMSAMLSACLLGGALFPQIGNRIEVISDAGGMALFTVTDVFCIGGIGMVILIFLLGIAVFPYFKKPLKDILSEGMD